MESEFRREKIFRGVSKKPGIAIGHSFDFKGLTPAPANDIQFY